MMLPCLKDLLCTVDKYYYPTLPVSIETDVVVCL